MNKHWEKLLKEQEDPRELVPAWLIITWYILYFVVLSLLALAHSTTQDILDSKPAIVHIGIFLVWSILFLTIVFNESKLLKKVCQLYCSNKLHKNK